MRLNRSSLAVAFFLLLFLSSKAEGQDGGPVEDPVGGGAFLLVPIGARSTALGQAGIATGGSVESAFWNPAGLALSEHSEFAVHYANTFASDNSALSGAFVAPGVGVLGLSAFIADFGAQEITNRTGGVNGRLAPKGIILMASLATRLGGALSVGVNYKLVQFRQDCSGACLSPGATRIESIVGTTQAFDLGVIFRGGPKTGFSLGAAIRHAGFKLQLENRDQADPLPTRLQLGVVYGFLVNEDEVAPILTKIFVDLEGKLTGFSSPNLRIGAETVYADVAFLRAGYSFIDGATAGPSVGVGLVFENVTLDVARAFFRTSSFEDPLFVTLRVKL
jgi:hypothetical protein